MVPRYFYYYFERRKKKKKKKSRRFLRVEGATVIRKKKVYAKKRYPLISLSSACIKSCSHSSAQKDFYAKKTYTLYLYRQHASRGALTLQLRKTFTPKNGTRQYLHRQHASRAALTPELQRPPQGRPLLRDVRSDACYDKGEAISFRGSSVDDLQSVALLYKLDPKKLNYL